MEIADIFVVNKSDRPGADTFVKNLKLMLPLVEETLQRVAASAADTLEHVLDADRRARLTAASLLNRLN